MGGAVKGWLRPAVVTSPKRGQHGCIPGTPTPPPLPQTHVHTNRPKHTHLNLPAHKPIFDAWKRTHTQTRIYLQYIHTPKHTISTLQFTAVLPRGAPLPITSFNSTSLHLSSTSLLFVSSLSLGIRGTDTTGSWSPDPVLA